jgi:hypothetical protein
MGPSGCGRHRARSGPTADDHTDLASAPAREMLSTILLGCEPTIVARADEGIG